jgi:hypothetical protein
LAKRACKGGKVLTPDIPAGLLDVGAQIHHTGQGLISS